jgi:imidazole glycerol-phosphate synthase subunit HisF
MLLPRIIPVLLLENNRLVKTVNFKDPKYIGDPINTVRIFNEKEVDELIILNIDNNKNPNDQLNYQLISQLAAESYMPLCYGGGIKNIDQVKKLISLGVEKVSICTHAVENYSFLESVIKIVGSQSLVVTIDVKKKDGLYKVTTDRGQKIHSIDFINYLNILENIGVGEVMINLIDRDGLMNGYDIKLAELVSSNLSLPCTFLGGASSLDNMMHLFKKCGLVGAAAGSLFVYKGPYKAVLINYPSKSIKNKIFAIK